MQAKYDTKRVDYLCHDKELSHFAQLIELNSGAVGREVFAVHFDSKRKEIRTCYNYRKVGHVHADYRLRGRKCGGKPNNVCGNGSMFPALFEKKEKREGEAHPM